MHQKFSQVQSMFPALFMAEELCATIVPFLIN